MKFFASRRLRNSLLTILALVGLAWWVERRQSLLAHASFDTGYLLLASLFFLAMFNVRKKLPVLPWTTSAAWLQLHIYVGLASAGVLAMHVGWRIPDGGLEVLLTLLYLATFCSGLIGLYWSRTLPPKLARVSEEVIYERIPLLSSQLRDQAQQAVLDAVRAAGTSTLGTFYSQRLHDFFEQPRSFGYFLQPNNRRRRQLLAELTELNRYLSEPERKAGEQLFALVRKRDDLDYHQAIQARLKLWLFVHIGLTYPLLLVACLHGLVAHLFDGGVL